MGSTLKALLAVGLLAGALVAMGTVASADPIVPTDPIVIDFEDQVTLQYRETMDYFVPELGAWATELKTTVDGAAVKPELAAELPELAYRGKLMVFDLEGTQVPDELKDAHETLIFAMGQLTEVAQIAVDDPAGADLLMGRYVDRLNDARHEIRVWLTADMQVDLGTAPVKLVAGK